jgi:hypothetical protein
MIPPTSLAEEKRLRSLLLSTADARFLTLAALFKSCSRIARMVPPTSSSLAEEKRLRSLLLSTADARFLTLAAC